MLSYSIVCIFLLIDDVDNQIKAQSCFSVMLLFFVPDKENDNISTTHV